MNAQHVSRTTAIRSRQHFLTAMLMLGTLLSATSALGQQMSFYPFRTAPLGSPLGTMGDPATPEFNSELDCWELHVPSGIEVHLNVQPSGWGDAPGSPTLAAIQATVDSAGYSNGLGGDLVPKSWAGNPQDGLLFTKDICSGNGDWCNPIFETTCGGGANGTCERNPDWVMTPCVLDFTAQATSTLDYAWATANIDICEPDDGANKTLGGWILNVPLDAVGTYVIEFDSGPNSSFMTDQNGTPIPGLTLTPACITVSPPPLKNRYLTFAPGESGPVAYKLDMVSSLFHPTATVSGWLGVPDANGIASLGPDPVTREWTEPVVHITGCEIAPVAEFELQASADDGATFVSSEPLQTTAQPGGGKFWGDIVGIFDGISWPPPNGVTNVDDAFAVILHFTHTAAAPNLPRTDVHPMEPNRVVNINDLLFVIFAFQGEPYPFGCPDDPCEDNMFEPCP